MQFRNLRSEAEKLLTKKANHHLIQNWPGPLAEFVLGRIDKESLRCKCQGSDDVETNLNHWLADFYLSLLALSNGDDLTWTELVRKTSDTSRAEWSSHDFFLGCVWNEEFFLARHEAREVKTLERGPVP